MNIIEAAIERLKFQLPFLMLFVGGIFFLALYYSIFPCVLFVFFVSLYLNSKLSHLVFIFFFALFLALISTQKIPESDSYNYVIFIQQIKNLSLSELMNYSYLSIRQTEFVFNISVWLLSKIESQGWLFFFIVNFYVYYVVLYYSYMYCYRNYPKYIVFCIVLSCGMVFISYSLVGHVTRQYMASIMLFQSVFILQRSKVCGTFIMILSVFVHNSVAPLLILMPIFSFIIRNYRKHISLFLMLCTGLSIGLAIPHSGLLNVRILELTEEPIPKYLFIFDIILFSYFYLFTYSKDKQEVISRNNVLTVLYSIYFLVLVLSSIDLFVVRYYFFIEPFRVLILLRVLLSLFRKKEGASLFFPILLVSVLIFLYRIEASPWIYSTSNIDVVINYSIIDYLDGIYRVWY